MLTNWRSRKRRSREWSGINNCRIWRGFVQRCARYFCWFIGSIDLNVPMTLASEVHCHLVLCYLFFESRTLLLCSILLYLHVFNELLQTRYLHLFRLERWIQLLKILRLLSNLLVDLEIWWKWRDFFFIYIFKCEIESRTWSRSRWFFLLISTLERKSDFPLRRPVTWSLILNALHSSRIARSFASFSSCFWFSNISSSSLRFLSSVTLQRRSATCRWRSIARPDHCDFALSFVWAWTRPRYCTSSFWRVSFFSLLSRVLR